MIMEDIVRPFQSKSILVTSRRVIASNVQKEVENATDQFGAAGDVPQPIQRIAPDKPPGTTIKFCDEENIERKKSRQYEEVEVHGQRRNAQTGEWEDDPDVILFVKRIRKIGFTKKTQENEKWTFTLDRSTGVISVKSNRDPCKNDYELTDWSEATGS